MQFRTKDFFPAISFLIVVILLVLVLSSVGIATSFGFPQEGYSDIGIPLASEFPPVHFSPASVGGNTAPTSASISARVSEKATTESPIPKGSMNGVWTSMFGNKPSGNTVSEGFEVELTKMEPSTNLDKDPVLDIFSHVDKYSIKPDASCHSAGLTNSRGYLCLSDDMVSLLKTRGGNQTA